MGLLDGLKKAMGGVAEQSSGAAAAGLPSPEVESAALVNQYEPRVARINEMEVND